MANGNDVSWSVRIQYLALFLYTSIVICTDGLSQPTIVGHTENYIETTYGTPLTLFCTASGSPLPTITWTKKSTSGFARPRKIVPTERISVTATNATFGKTEKMKSVLTIKMVTLKDKGKFKCKATNTNGSHTYEIEVLVSGKPMAPKHDKSVVINSSSILVSWDAVTKVADTIIYYTLYYNADQEKNINAVNITTIPQLLNYSFIITGLEQLTTYIIYISATNKYGEGEKSGSTIEETMPEDPKPPEMSLDGKNAITHQTISLKFVPSRRNKRKIFGYQIFVENIQDRLTTRPLTLPSIYGNHSLNKSKDHIYIAANFDDKLPDNFVLGNEKWYGYHYNARLKPLTKYRIYVRALARDHVKQEKIVFGKAITLEESTVFPPVPKVVLTKVAENTLEISWEKIDSNSIYYKLQVKQNDEIVFSDEKITEVPYKLKDLKEGGTYVAYLSICSKTKCKTSTEPVLMKTVSRADGGNSMQLLIIIIAVAVVVLIIVVIIAVVCFVRRRRRQKEGFLKGSKTNGEKSLQAKNQGSKGKLDEEEIGLIETSDGTNVAETELKPIRARPVVGNGDSSGDLRTDWECPKGSIKAIKDIENDAFGKICKGAAKNFHDFENGSVMIRTLKDNPSESMKSEFLSILDTMKKLPVHKGIVNLLGCMTKPDNLTIIMEYVPCGDLLGYLRSTRGLHDEHYKSEKSPINDLSSVELISFAEQVASAMVHLERHKILHGDLAARNVLVDHHGLCKLTNIGEHPIVFGKDTYSTKKKGRLIMKWAAAEVLFKKIRTIQSDVWSFGIMLYEISTVGGCPYTGKDEKWVLDMLKDDYRLPCPEHVSEALYSVMSDCWLNEPDERPNFEKLVKVMRTLTLMNKHQDHINMEKYDGQLFSKLDDS